MKKVALYARVSTGLQVTEGSSLDTQIDFCRNKAHEIGFTDDSLINFREEGVSGEDIDRPSLNQLREVVANGGISHVIVTHPDRLSRDLTDKLYICREFEVHDVKLIFVDTEYQNTPEGLLFFNLMSVIAQYELSLIKKRTIRGRLRAVEKDQKIMPMRVAPFGYDLLDQKLVINETEAEAVRNIYKWYAIEHLTLRQIGERLVEMGVLPKRGESKNWNASSILNILSSEVYIGNYYYNRRKFRKVKGGRTKGGAPKKTYDFRNKEEWIRVNVPPIIENSLSELVRQQKLFNKKSSGNRKYDYLLKSKLKCGICGRTWDCTTYTGRVNKETGEKTRYTCYRCPNHFPRRYGDGVVSCPSKTIRADLLDKYIWEMVMNALSNPEDYLEHMMESKDTVDVEIRSALSLLNIELSRKEKELERVKTLFIHGITEEKEMLEQASKLNVEKKTIVEKIQNYSIQLERIDEDQHSVEKIRSSMEQVKRFIESGGDILSLEDKRHVVDTLIDEIIIKYEDDFVSLTVIGHLSELEDISQHKGFVLQRSFKLVQRGRYSEKTIVED